MAHSRFNIAVRCCHVIEVNEHLAILIRISLVSELGMQLLVTVRNPVIFGIDVIARRAPVQGVLEVMRRLRQGLCVAADAAATAVITLILELRREVAARVIKTRRRFSQ
jgi:hypothetical protein